MPNEKLETEKEMMRFASTGDEASFVKLFYLYRHKLYSYTLRITESPELAEDMVQDVFLKLWKNRSQLDKVEHFGAFIFKMVQNQAFNAFKRMANETLILSKMQNEVDGYKTGPEQDIEYKEVQFLINRVVKKLPPQQNLVFKLSREQGLKHHEIAQLLKISPYTVKNHLVVALQTIRENLRRNLKIESLPLFIMALHWFKN
ncbi:MAG: RNA polymerase sigma-70 factor [Ginsengibacter sp.]